MRLTVRQRDTDFPVLDAGTGHFMNKAILVGDIVTGHDFNGRFDGDLSLGWLQHN